MSSNFDDLTLDELTLDELVAHNQLLGAQQDAIRAERKAIADEIRARVARGPAVDPAPGDGAATGALPTVDPAPGDGAATGALPTVDLITGQ